MCIYLDVYVCVCVCVYIYLYLYIYIYIYIDILILLKIYKTSQWFVSWSGVILWFFYPICKPNVD